MESINQEFSANNSHKFITSDRVVGIDRFEL